MNDGLTKMSLSIKPKWEVIYSYGEKGSVFINQKQYDKLIEASEEAINSGKQKNLQLKDGTVLSTAFKNIRVNPEWRDPALNKAKEIYYKLRNDFMERKRNGESITWEEYKSSKKIEVKKEYSDFLKNNPND